MEAMWLFDEEGEEWENFRKEAQDVEKEHLAIRVALRDAEAALRADPGSEQLQTRIAELKKEAGRIGNAGPLDLFGSPRGSTPLGSATRIAPHAVSLPLNR